MVILMNKDATRQQVHALFSAIRELGLEPHATLQAQGPAVCVTGKLERVDPALFKRFEGVARVVSVSEPYKLVSRELHPEPTVIHVRGVQIGGGAFCVMAGPCSVETQEQVMSTATHVRKHGAHVLRGGAFKPRTSPYDFQGLKADGLRLLAEARELTQMPIITEVKDVETLALVAEYADILQIGARNMQNFSLLERVGEQEKPVMLKRGLSATVKEWLMAAEYVVSRGNRNVILCERGIRTFETMTRNTLDLGVLPVLRSITHLPIIVDPSHGTGVAKAVIPLARAAAAVGVDGIMVEVHPEPARALSDGPQALTFPMFEVMMRDVSGIVQIMGQTLACQREDQRFALTGNGLSECSEC